MHRVFIIKASITHVVVLYDAMTRVNIEALGTMVEYVPMR